MKNVKFILLILFIVPNFVFGQNSINSAFIEPFQKDALYREKVFIHTNKTTYFVNENIWFTAYVGIDSSENPSDFTTNLHVNLLDKKGKVIVNKTIFIKEGVGIGDFFLDSKLASGKYYIQGFTNFMKNFGKENVYLQEIELISEEKNQSVNDKTSENKYDIQAFPESGYLLEGVQNNVGIKALINGKGFPFIGNVKNSKGEKVASVTGNFLGMAKTNFLYKKNENYILELNINNTFQKINIPKAQKKGIIFEIDNDDVQKLKLTLKTNKETLPSLKKDKISILFYRNNFICEAITLTINNDLKTSQGFLFDKQKMLHGVNIITLFKNNEPIAERKFFVDKPDKQSAILIEKINTINDSIQYKIKTIDSNNLSIDAQLSISTLPNESKVFEEKQNIKSAFLLSPYVKGIIENPAFYFNDTNPNEKQFLDLLLLNQGWSAYKLPEMITLINPKKEYDFESGFTIKGSLKKVPKGYDIGLISKKNRLASFSKFNKNNEFSFENIYAYKYDTAKVGLIKKDKPLVKPNKISLIENQIEFENYGYLISEPNKTEESQITKTAVKEVVNFSPEAEQLNIVKLKNVRKKRIETIYDKEANIAVRRKELAPGFYQNKKVTPEMEDNFRSMFEYFRHLGIIKGPCGRGFSPCFFVLRTLNVSIIIKAEPLIYLNGARMNNESVIQDMRDISMREVDEILINRSGAGGGYGAAGGIIKINTKKGDHQYFEQPSRKLYENLVLLTGFDRAKEYYKPLYNVYTKNTLNWTETDWQNSLKTDSKGEVIIKVPVNGFSNDYQLIINGFSKEGLLFHHIYKGKDDDF